MTDWAEANTADLIAGGVLEIGDGYRAKHSEFAHAGGLPFVRVGDVSSTICLDGRDELPLAERQKYEPKVSQPFDSVITMKGTVGRVAWVGSETRQFVYSPQISYWRSHDHGVVHPRWLRYWLESPEFVWQAAATKGATDMADYINLGDQRRMKITLPPPSTQVRIAGVLSSIDELIENNRRRVEVLEEMARAIYREWFVHFRFPGHEDATFVDSDLGLIPEGWRASTCGKELHFVGGGTPSKKEPAYWDGGTVDWFTPSDLTKSKPRYPRDSGLRITDEGLRRSSAKLIPPGTVMMTSRATLGVLAIATGPASTNQGFISVLPDDRWPSNFIREFLDASAEGLSTIATGATFKEITKGAFKTFPFVVPSQPMLENFQASTEAAEQTIERLEASTARLTQIRDLLLPKLVTGQIDVSGLELDALVEKSGV